MTYNFDSIIGIQDAYVDAALKAQGRYSALRRGGYRALAMKRFIRLGFTRNQAIVMTNDADDMLRLHLEIERDNVAR